MPDSMVTVREAARIVSRDRETVRRWIRSGRLRAQRVGTHYLIDRSDLQGFIDDSDVLPLPPEWQKTWTGEPPLNSVRAIRLSRRGR
jgi:excisionase family DNA binding protein